MVRISNNLIGILNLVTFVLSVPILSTGIWLSNRSSTDCEKFLEKPLIVIGVFLLLVSLSGIVGACCRVSFLLWIYLVVTFLLIILLFCFTIFAFVVTNKGAGEVLSGKGYKEYKLGDYSSWLQKRVTNGKNWRKIESCLQDSKFCQKMVAWAANGTALQFSQKHLSSIQSGCCKPSDECNFVYVGPIEWNVNPGIPPSANPDCNLWSNGQTALCYRCESCKAGVLDNIKSDWKKVSVVNVIFLVFLVIVYSIGCCAFRNNREDNYYSRRKPYA